MEAKGLISGCRQNDRQTQNLLFEKYEKKVLTISLRYSCSLDEAKDIQQETFIKIFKALAFKSIEIQSLDLWVRKIAVNTAIDYYRKLKKLKETFDNSTQEVSSPPEIVSQLNEEDIIQLIQSIPSPYRLVFNLFAIEGYSHKEIGHQLNITESTSRSYLTRAKEIIKRKLNPEVQFNLKNYG